MAAGRAGRDFEIAVVAEEQFDSDWRRLEFRNGQAADDGAFQQDILAELHVELGKSEGETLAVARLWLVAQDEGQLDRSVGRRTGRQSFEPDQSGQAARADQHIAGDDGQGYRRT